MKWCIKCFIYRTAGVKSSKLWTHKWPALNVSGFIAQLLRASHLYREVTGSNPVLTLSGFYIRYRIIAFITKKIIASLIHLFVIFKSLHLNLIYIPTILFRRGGLLNLFHPYTAFPPQLDLVLLSTCCQFETKSSDVDFDTFRTPKVQLFFRLVKLVQSYFTLIHIVSQESLLYLKEKARRRQ